MHAAAHGGLKRDQLEAEVYMFKAMRSFAYRGNGLTYCTKYSFVDIVSPTHVSGRGIRCRSAAVACGHVLSNFVALYAASCGRDRIILAPRLTEAWLETFRLGGCRFGCGEGEAGGGDLPGCCLAC